jgi:hypothetical protein
MFEISDESNPAVRARIEEEFFPNSTLKLDWNVEGQKIRDGRVFVGAKAGPSIHESHACHEMAHFVEIDDARCGLYGWGLKVREVWVFDRMCVEPETHQMIDRELRVIAYQVNLLDHVEAKADALDRSQLFDDAVSAGGAPAAVALVTSLRFMADWCMLPRRGRDQHSNDVSRVVWCARRVERLRRQKKYGIESFRREWKRKNEVLRNFDLNRDGL